MQSWFPLFPTPQSPAVCHICLLCPFQAYLVSDGPSGSLSHPPLPGRECPLIGLQCCWGECNAGIGRRRVHRAFSLSELPLGVELQTLCLKLPQLGSFAVEAPVLSTWRPSVDASAETSGVRVDVLSNWLVLSPCIRDSQKSSESPQSEAQFFFYHSPFLMVLISHLYMITGKIIVLPLQTSVAKWISVFNTPSRFFITFLPSKEQVCFNFVVAVKVHSDFGAQENKNCHCFHISLIYMLEVVGLDALNVGYFCE